MGHRDNAVCGDKLLNMAEASNNMTIAGASLNWSVATDMSDKGPGGWVGIGSARNYPNKFNMLLGNLEADRLYGELYSDKDRPYTDFTLYGSWARLKKGKILTGSGFELGATLRIHDTEHQDIDGKSYEYSGKEELAIHLGTTYYLLGGEWDWGLVLPYISSSINYPTEKWDPEEASPARLRRWSVGISLMLGKGELQKEEKGVSDLEFGMEVGKELVSSLRAYLTHRYDKETFQSKKLVEDSVSGGASTDPLFVGALCLTGVFDIYNDTVFYLDAKGTEAGNIKLLAKVLRGVGFLIGGLKSNTPTTTGEGIKELVSLATMLIAGSD